MDCFIRLLYALLEQQIRREQSLASRKRVWHEFIEPLVHLFEVLRRPPLRCGRGFDYRLHGAVHRVVLRNHLHPARDGYYPTISDIHESSLLRLSRQLTNLPATVLGIKPFGSEARKDLYASNAGRSRSSTTRGKANVTLSLACRQASSPGVAPRHLAQWQVRAPMHPTERHRRPAVSQG